MNTLTGQFHAMQFGETKEQLAARVGGNPADFVEVARMPDGVCKKCKGTGRLKRGLFSKRFKPCDCVL